jgi:hypothetical protein
MLHYVMLCYVMALIYRASRVLSELRVVCNINPNVRLWEQKKTLFYHQGVHDNDRDLALHVGGAFANRQAMWLSFRCPLGVSQ